MIVMTVTCAHMRAECRMLHAACYYMLLSVVSQTVKQTSMYWPHQSQSHDAWTHGGHEDIMRTQEDMNFMSLSHVCFTVLHATIR